MKTPLRILLLEDDAHDAELIQEFLEADHFVCEITRTQTRAEFVVALEDVEIDVILADYTLPSFDGLSALMLASSARPDLPFIFVSGTLGEEVAIEALKIGATDYVVKTRLSRLVPSVQRALREADERAERQTADIVLPERKLDTLSKSRADECRRRGPECRRLEREEQDAIAALDRARAEVKASADPQAAALGISSATLHLVQGGAMVALCLFSGLFISFGAGLIWPRGRAA